MKVARIRLAGLTAADRVLVGVAVLSLVALALELTWPHPLDALVVNSTPPPATRDGEASGAIDAKPGPPIDGILTRPLFTMDRRPYIVPVEPPAAQEERPPEPNRAVEFELLGVVTTPNARIALIGTGASSPVIKLRVGESIEGWTLEAVGQDAVVLRNGERRHTVELYAREEANPD